MPQGNCNWAGGLAQWAILVEPTIAETDLSAHSPGHYRLRAALAANRQLARPTSKDLLCRHFPFFPALPRLCCFLCACLTSEQFQQMQWMGSPQGYTALCKLTMLLPTFCFVSQRLACCVSNLHSMPTAHGISREN
jgi:hypothetical protein